MLDTVPRALYKKSFNKNLSREVLSLPPFFKKLFIFFGCAYGMWKFQGQGMNPHHSSNPSHCSDKASSLTLCHKGTPLSPFYR